MAGTGALIGFTCGSHCSSFSTSLKLNDGMKGKDKERIINAITFNCDSIWYGRLKENTSLKLYLSDSSVQILAIPLL